MQHRTEIWVEFLSTAYPAFLASDAYDIDADKDRLRDRYAAAGEATMQDVLVNKEEVEKLMGELEGLKKPVISVSCYYTNQ